MKSKKFILGLALTLTLGLTVVANAATTNTNSSTAPNPQHKIACKKGFAGRGAAAHDAVLAKFGITSDEIKATRDAHKPLTTLLEEKGIKLEDFKAALIEEKGKLVDESVASGKMTKEEGDKIKEKIKNNILTCDTNNKCHEKKFKNHTNKQNNKHNNKQKPNEEKNSVPSEN